MTGTIFDWIAAKRRYDAGDLAALDQYHADPPPPRAAPAPKAPPKPEQQQGSLM